MPWYAYLITLAFCVAGVTMLLTLNGTVSADVFSYCNGRHCHYGQWRTPSLWTLGLVGAGMLSLGIAPLVVLLLGKNTMVPLNVCMILMLAALVRYPFFSDDSIGNRISVGLFAAVVLLVAVIFIGLIVAAKSKRDVR